MKLRLWVDIAEITASIAVVATLLILFFQIQESNEIEKRQSALRQAQWDAQMFLTSERLPEILTKIKTVDGEELTPWMERYDLDYEEAAIWNRWLTLMWRGLEADYLLIGPSDSLEENIRLSTPWPDQKLFLAGALYPDNPFFDPDFTIYVNRILEDAL